MPDQLTAGDGETLVLNGMGVREYGLFGIDIYVAGLYLFQPHRDFDSIRRQSHPVVILMDYVRGGGEADDVRAFWRQYLVANCDALACTWPGGAVEEFLALLRPAEKGARERYEFVGGHLTYVVGGNVVGSVANATLNDLVLACWIGPVPSTRKLRDAMLGKR